MTTGQRALLAAAGRAPGGGGGGFDPTDIANLVLWLDASQLTGLSDNDPVATWSDLSGQGNHATQSTSGDRPIYKTNQLNGLAGVDFASSKHLRCDSVAASFSGTDKPFTIFQVVKWPTSSTGGMSLGMGRSTATTQRWRCHENLSGGGFRLLKRDDASVTVTVGGTGGGVDSSWHYWTSRCPGTTASIRKDGASYEASAAFDNGTQTLDQCAIGANIAAGTVSSQFNGVYAALIVYAASLSDSDRDLVEGYIDTRWAL